MLFGVFAPRTRIGRLLLAAQAAPALYFANEHVATVRRIAGQSMKPALVPGLDVVVFRRPGGAALGGLAHGDVLLFAHPRLPGVEIVKRVVGFPGDVVVPRGSDADVRVPEGHLWVEGDESFHSTDSNAFGPVPVALITGVAAGIVWPPRRSGSIQGNGSWRERVRIAPL